MKHISILMLIFILSYFSSSALMNDTNHANDSNDYSLILIGGAGMTTGGNFGFIDSYFNLGPAIAIGLEIPFTKSHIFALELFNHFWLGKVKNDWFTSNDYQKISEKVYSQGGLSSVIKFYIFNKNSDIRFSLHLGAVLFSTVKIESDYNALDLGFGIYYRISDNIQLNLNRRYLIGEFDLGGGSKERTQNLLMLNICYNFKW